MIFRYRISDYRALYKYKKIKNLILITKIDKRPRIHNQFKIKRKTSL